MRTVRNLLVALVFVVAAQMLSATPATAQYQSCQQLEQSCESQLGCGGNPFSCFSYGNSYCGGPPLYYYYVDAHCWNPWTDQVQSGTCIGGSCTPSCHEPPCDA